MSDDTTTAIERVPTRAPGNAVTHGLYSEVAVAAGHEREQDWLAFHEAMLESLAPDGALETTLVSRAASLCWRLRRVPLAEAALIERGFQRRRESAAQADEMVAAGHGFYADAVRGPAPISAPDPASAERIYKMEAHLSRQLTQTLHELEALQARRRGERTPLARIDVHGA
jgi:hypothetical protein